MNKTSEMKQYFIDNCMSFSAFAKKNELDKSTLMQVLDGRLKCEVNRSGEDGKAAKVARVLWEQGIWVGEKPKVLQKIDNEIEN